MGRHFGNDTSDVVAWFGGFGHLVLLQLEAGVFSLAP